MFNFLIKKYYRKLLTYSNTRIVFELVIVSVAVKVITGLLLLAIGEIYGNKFIITQIGREYGYEKENIIILLFLAVVAAPIIETLAIQWLTIFLLRKITNNYMFIVMAATGMFALAHVSYDGVYALIVIPGGIILSWAFYCKYKKSLWEALKVTYSIHAIHNLIGVISIMMYRI